MPAVIQALPRDGLHPGGGRFIDDGSIDHVRWHRPRRARRHFPRRVQVPMPPPAGQTRRIPDEVIIEVSNSVSAQQVTALQNRFRLQRIESHRFALTATTMFRWRIPDDRSVPDVIRALEQDSTMASAQPNYLYSLQQGKPRAKAIPRNTNSLSSIYRGPTRWRAATTCRVAGIDSTVDLQSPNLAGSIAGTFDTLKSPRKPHAHCTAIAALIAGHGKLMGAAPGAKILAVRAFDPNSKSGATGSTFTIPKGLDWAAENHARIINMSFAGRPIRRYSSRCRRRTRKASR